MVKVSNSRFDVYEGCGYKFKLKYMDRLRTEKVFSSLHLGGALDTTLNKVLLATKDNIPVTLDELNETFKQAFTYYKFDDGNNELVDVTSYEQYDYYKKEFKPLLLTADQVMLVHDLYGIAPETATWEKTRKAYNLVSWCSNFNLGNAVVKTYYEDILPAILKDFEIVSVQEELKVENDEGDIFTAILDFTAKHKTTGNYHIMDNKSASTDSMKKDYKEGCVEKSQQLALYAEFKNWNHAGYVVYEKKINDNGKVNWVIRTGETTESTKELIFNKFDNLLVKIKQEVFDKNEKNCYSYGRPCEFWGYCKYGKIDGLFRKPE